MKTVLVINASINSEQGNSFKATQLYLDALQADNKELRIVSLDLEKENLPHLSAAEMQAWSMPYEEKSDEQKRISAFSDKYIELMQQADEIVFGVPMYNFGIPSVLKAFFDRVARAGITFTYTANGP